MSGQRPVGVDGPDDGERDTMEAPVAEPDQAGTGPGHDPESAPLTPPPGLDKWRPIVLVNLLWLVPGVVGGSEESITDSLRAVADLMGSDLNTEGLDLHLAVLRPFLDAHPDLADRFPLEVLDADGSDKVRRVVAEQTWLARATRRVGARVVHHAGGIVPLRHPGRVVLTLHDLQPLDLPANFTTAKRSYIRAMAKRSVRAADVVCVPSAFTRGRAIELLGAPAEKFLVVPWSVASRPPSTPAPSAPPLLASTWPASTLPASTSHLVPDGRYFLFPAITHPHKNHSVLLDAFSALVRDDPGCDVQLVLTGREGSAEDEVIRRYFEPGLAGRVMRPGRIPADQLDALFRDASAVVFPSRYEGFGLPILEAMSRGVPVIASRAGSLPELARPEDLVDPDDVGEWVAAMRTVLTQTPESRDARIAEGKRIAAGFTAERTASGLIEAYRRALAADPDRHDRRTTPRTP